MFLDKDVFSGGVAVLTGAGAGIGAGPARRAGALSMNVMVTDVALDRPDALAAHIRADGGQLTAMVVMRDRAHRRLGEKAKQLLAR